MPYVLTDFDATRGIVWITINRPEVLNAINLDVAHGLRDAVLPLAQNPDVRCVVLRGMGRAFAAGGDVARFADDFDKSAAVIEELLESLNPVVETLRTIDAPVLGSVQGAAAGAGLSLVSMCDIVVAAQGTRFLMAYDRIGAVPDCGGTYFLPRAVGVRMAAQLMMLSDTLSADEAKTAGLVNFVVADDSLGAETETLAAKLAAGPTKSFGEYKRLVRDSFSRSLHDQLEAERDAFKLITRTQDFRNGVSAFLAKGKTEFRGK